jgi:hypothetical protein
MECFVLFTQGTRNGDFPPLNLGTTLIAQSDKGVYYDFLRGEFEVGMTLSNRTKSRISLLVLFLLFEAGIIAIKFISTGLELSVFTWIMLVFAASLGGAGISYLAIGDFIRWPFTKEVRHSSSPSMIEIEPKYEGWLNSVGVLMCCPICAATWVGAGLLGLMAIDYTIGYYTVLALATGGAARVIIRLSEVLEWQARAAQERTAELNRKNVMEEAQKGAIQLGNGWFIRSEEEITKEQEASGD